MNFKKLILTIIFLSILVTSVQSYNLNPPVSINISGYISTHNQIGVWWLNPSDTDFKGVQIWFDNIYIKETNKTTNFFYAEFLSLGDHTFSAHTVDNYNNVNSTWTNITISNDGYFTCKEEWFCDNYCGLPIIRTPIDPKNITPSQPPYQMAKQYTDINLWYFVLLVTLICLLLSRDPDVKTVRPMIFTTISFLTSVSLIWMSLSIAYIGNFTEGAIVEYTNQTNSAIYYYQIIQVVSNPWVTILCICITIMVIINSVDIIMRYIQKSEDANIIKENKNWKI